MPRRYLGQKKVSFPARNGIPTACRAGKCPKSCAEGAPEAFGAEKGIISGAERDANRLPSRNRRQILRRRCTEAAPGRKRHHFLRGMGYHLPAEQKNAPNPARNGMPTACRAEKCPKSCAEAASEASRAEKHPNSCAEGTSEASRAEKHPNSCAEWDTGRLPSRKFKINLVKCRIITTFARSNVWRFQFLNVFETINNV